MELLVDSKLSEGERMIVIDKLFDIKDKEGSEIVNCSPSKARIRICLIFWESGGRMIVFRDTDTKALIGLVVYSWENTWWGDNSMNVLIEHMVLCVNKSFKGFGRIAIKALERVAREKKCSAIISGSYLTKETKHIENMYKKQGFTQVCPSFVKVLKYDE